MLNAPSAQLRPNPLTQSAEEDEEQHREHMRFRDTTNVRQRHLRKGKTIATQNDKENLSVPEKLREKVRSKEKKKSEPAIKPNLLIEFQSEEEEIEERDQSLPSNPNKAIMKSNLPEISQIPNKNPFLLNLDLDEDEEQIEEPQLELQEGILERKETSNSTDIVSSKPGEKGIKHGVLLNFEEEQQQEQEEQNNESDKSMNSIQGEESQDQHKRKCVDLSTLIRDNRDRYYLQAIPKNKVFQCVIKRDRNSDSIKYHVYDNVTLRNFITILKDDDGYLVISKYESSSTKHIYDSVRKEKIIGRIISNFFGTQFNCMVENTPYKAGKEYPSNPKKERIITIEYQTNFFGMRGPRKMKAFMTNGVGFEGKALNEVYQSQKQLKSSDSSKKRVFAFKNKSPKWSAEVGSYVLNFEGRATISSVKNFIMVGEDESDKASAKVLFGKFGKQLFNLDIRYPFNILQGVTLAISSFDRKLGCE